MKLNVVLAALAAVLASSQAFAFAYAPGHLYSTSDNAINEYTATGTLVDSLMPSGGQLRGLAFGPDGNLYVVRLASTATSTPSVDVIRQDGTIARSMPFTGLISGNISYGKISFDPGGQRFYVGVGNGLYRFETSGTAGSLAKNVDAFDVKALDGGELLVATANALTHYSGSGATLGSISSLVDPYGLTGDPAPRLVDVRGVEYDPTSNKTYVTMLGYSGSVNMSFKLLALEGFTNRIVGLENYWYGDDLYLPDSERLLVGSRTLAPAVFGTDLGLRFQLQGPAARFVTTMPVPEPVGAVALLVGSLGLLVRRSRSGA